MFLFLDFVKGTLMKTKFLQTLSRRSWHLFDECGHLYSSVCLFINFVSQNLIRLFCNNIYIYIYIYIYTCCSSNFTLHLWLLGNVSFFLDILAMLMHQLYQFQFSHFSSMFSSIICGTLAHFSPQPSKSFSKKISYIFS